LAGGVISNGNTAAHTARSELQARPPASGCGAGPDAVNWLIKRIGERARFAFPVHAHMFQHACGYAWPTLATTHDASRIGYRSIQHTTCYMQLSPAPFKDFWR
jgi:hypothetical protein